MTIQTTGQSNNVISRKYRRHIKLKQVEQQAKKYGYTHTHIGDALVVQPSHEMLVFFAKGVVVHWYTDSPQVNVEELVPGSEEDAPLAYQPTERYMIEYGSEFKIDEGTITLDKTDGSLLVALSHALARSVQIDFDEHSVSRLLNVIDSIQENMRTKGRIGRSRKQIRKLIGQVLETKYNLSTYAQVNDNPELLWEDSTLQPYFVRLSQELELSDRWDVLEEKTRFLEDMLSILRDEVNTKQSHLLEWGIIWLIIFEIVLYFLEKL